jgi:hypothetical protein
MFQSNIASKRQCDERDLFITKTRLTIRAADEDDYDRRPQRRRYEDPLPIKVRKQLLAIAESPLKRVEEEIQIIAKLVVDNYDDEEVKTMYLDLSLQMVVEQPFKIPFVSAVVLLVNTLRQEVAAEILAKAAQKVEAAIAGGNWRDVKLLMKFLGGLQGVLEGDGVWSVLEELFSRAVDLQTASSDDVSIGPLDEVKALKLMNSRPWVRNSSKSFYLLFLISWLLLPQTSSRRLLSYSTRRISSLVHHTPSRLWSMLTQETARTNQRSQQVSSVCCKNSCRLSQATIGS